MYTTRTACADRVRPQHRPESTAFFVEENGSKRFQAGLQFTGAFFPRTSLISELSAQLRGAHDQLGPPNARLSFIRLRGRRSSAELASLGLCDSRGVERSRGTGVPAVRRAVRLRDSPERSLLGPPLIEGSKSFGPKIHWFTIRVFTRHVTRSSTLFKKCSKTGCRGIYSVCPCTSSRTNAS